MIQDKLFNRASLNFFLFFKLSNSLYSLQSFFAITYKKKIIAISREVRSELNRCVQIGRTALYFTLRSDLSANEKLIFPCLLKF
jgi:hypothetical protein